MYTAAGPHSALSVGRVSECALGEDHSQQLGRFTSVQMDVAGAASADTLLIDTTQPLCATHANLAISWGGKGKGGAMSVMLVKQIKAALV